MNTSELQRGKIYRIRLTDGSCKVERNTEMKKLEIGEWCKWVSRPLVQSMGLSVIDFQGHKTTFWVIRDVRGAYQCLEVVKVV